MKFWKVLIGLKKSDENKTIIGLKFIRVTHNETSDCDENKTIIGLKCSCFSNNI